jgi:glycosyltransferase involved in cell wall biosynthesis
MTSSPAVTVLLSVYNGAAVTGAAIDSILAQTFGDFELLAIDDGSTDATASVLASYRDARIRVLRNERNLGLTRSLNIGLRAARGELVARQDADDTSLPERLERQVAAMHRHPEVALVGGQARYLDQKNRAYTPREWRKCTSPVAIEWQSMFENPFIHTAAMFRRAAIEALGGYDEAYRTSQDFELWSRVIRRYSTRNLSEDVVELRARAGSLSSTYDLAALRRIIPVFLDNRNHSLQRALTEDRSLEILLSVWNPRIFAAIGDLSPFTSAVVEMHRRFLEIHPAAQDDPEIAAHCATLLSRIARAAAADAPDGLWNAVSTVRRFDRAAFRRAVPSVAARLAAGPILRRLRPRGSARLYEECT